MAKATIANFETGRREPYPRTLDDLRQALEAAGVIFIAENGEGPGVRMRKLRPTADEDGTPDGWTTDPDEADRGRRG